MFRTFRSRGLLSLHAGLGSNKATPSRCAEMAPQRPRLEYIDAAPTGLDPLARHGPRRPRLAAKRAPAQGCEVLRARRE